LARKRKLRCFQGPKVGPEESRFISSYQERYRQRNLTYKHKKSAVERYFAETGERRKALLKKIGKNYNHQIEDRL